MGVLNALPLSAKSICGMAESLNNISGATIIYWTSLVKNQFSKKEKVKILLHEYATLRKDLL